MNSVFERIRYNSNLPARIEIKQGKIAEAYHWHKEIELIYVLDGEVTVTVNNTVQTLREDEFVLNQFGGEPQPFGGKRPMPDGGYLL